MASLNQVHLIGRLGRDPEQRFTQAGGAISNFSVATDEGYKDQQGNKVEKTEWHRVVAFGKTAELCSKYLSKGSLVYVSGKLQTRKWQDKQGVDRYQTEIVAQNVQFLDRKESGGNRGAETRQSGTQAQDAPQEDDGPQFPNEAGGTDEVPFIFVLIPICYFVMNVILNGVMA